MHKLKSHLLLLLYIIKFVNLIFILLQVYNTSYACIVVILIKALFKYKTVKNYSSHSYNTYL